MPEPAPDISIVVAVLDARRAAGGCLAAIERERAGHAAEVIAVAGADDETAALVTRESPRTTLLQVKAGALTPVLWAAGAAYARGRIVVFTTAHCTPRPGWLQGLTASMAPDGRAAVGGPLVPAEGTGPLDWAVFYLRYSAFLPETIGADGDAGGEIAGDNAAYARDVLERHASLLTDGFWELDIHRAIRREGLSIAVSRAATVAFGPSFSFGTIARHRFAHGRHSGSSRVRGGTRRRWQVLAAAPLVPAVLVLRAARRVLPLDGHRWRFVAGLPLFLTLATVWAAGEAAGAWYAPDVRPGARRP